MTTEEIQQNVEEIFRLYEKFGAHEYYGEEVSQLEHMCQSAQLAQEGGYPEDVILGAFFHDIGYFIQSEQEEVGEFGRANHEAVAANYLRKMGFSETVAKLAEQHVNAKRYLTFADPNYYNQLSNASKKTLEKQGGPMKKDEAEAFASDPLFPLYIANRKWDELAKVTNKPLPDLNRYKEMAKRHLFQQQKTAS